MASHNINLLYIFFGLVLFAILSEGSTPSNLTWWCSKTPHPEPCTNAFATNKHRHYAPNHRSDFRKMLVQLAIDRAVKARDKFLHFGPNCTQKHEKSAWADCVKLYNGAILQMKRTLEGLNSVTDSDTCTDFDAQTWLSTALTNIQTCKLGSADLNVSDSILPFMSNYINLSNLISNSLAVNGVLLKQHNHSDFMTSNKNEYPSWVSRSDRRFLRSSLTPKANLVVAKDGSGHFKTIQAALNAASKRRVKSRFVIHVKRGVYGENIEVALNNNNIMLVGDGMRYTIITSRRSVQDGYTTYNSATAGIDGLHFIAKDITFINTAGPQKGQAVALRSSSDLSVFYRCSFQGYQDTLMVHSQRQFYRECYIYGTIDFIFGNAAVVFQKCIIMVRRPLKGQANVITAQGRGDPYQNTGITIQNSIILPAPDLRPMVPAFKTYLGRPWQEYSRTVVMTSYIDGMVSPLGWSPWTRGSNFALNTLYYGEYKNFGPSSSTRLRVRWKGFHVITSAAVASRFTVGGLIAGKSWLPATGVPFAAGL